MILLLSHILNCIKMCLYKVLCPCGDVSMTCTSVNSMGTRVSQWSNGTGTRAGPVEECYDKDLYNRFYLFTRCTDTGVIVTHALSFYRPLAPLFSLTHAQLAVVTQSCALLYIAVHCDLLLQ